MLDVLARLSGIFTAVTLHAHPAAECLLDRMIGAIERIRGRTWRQQAAVASKEMFEPEVGHKLTFRGCRRATIVLRAVANKNERLRSALPFQRVRVESP